MFITIIATHLANVIKRKNAFKQPNVLERKGGVVFWEKIFYFLKK